MSSTKKDFTPAPKPKPEPVLDAKATEKKELLDKITEVLKEYGSEGNIPINHDYWVWMNRYRGL